MPVSCSLFWGQADGPVSLDRGIEETSRTSSRTEARGFGGVVEADSVEVGEEKEGRRSHDVHEEDCCGCCGCVERSGTGGLDLLLAFCAASSFALACCIHSSRVLWSTGHFSSAPAFAPRAPASLILAVFGVFDDGVPPLGSSCPAFTTSLPTKTVSTNSWCILCA